MGSRKIGEGEGKDKGILVKKLGEDVGIIIKRGVKKNKAPASFCHNMIDLFVVWPI